jgi:ferredoxin--NADP+ reductase
MEKATFKNIAKPVTLKEIIQEATDTYTYKFNIPKGITWTAGANLHLLPYGLDEDIEIDKKTVHHLSIINLPGEGYIGITTRIRKQASDFKKKLQESQIGDTMCIFKVKNHMPLKRENHPVVLISMGVGIATMRPLILEYVTDQTNIPAMININVDNSGTFIYKRELISTEKHGVKNDFTKSRTEIKEAIKTTFQLKDPRYYIVGSDNFLSNMSGFLLKNHIEKHQIYFDKHQEDIEEILKNI